MTVAQPPPAANEPLPPAGGKLAAAENGPQRQPSCKAQRQKCEFFLPRKNRCCKFDAIPGKKFCGNHLPEEQGGGHRIPCPYDPHQSHTVLASELEKHRLRCPNYLLMLADREQPFYQKDANAGPAHCAAVLPDAPPEMADSKGRTDSASARRPAFAARLGEQRLRELLQRVEAAHAVLCPPARLSVMVPPDVAAEGDRMAQQQASIVANMQEAGLLSHAEERTYVEMGAGKGYLSYSLADASSARKLVLVDVQSGFRNKADRGLRQLEIQRLRCDLKDFKPTGVAGLEAGQPWVGLGKHLCGAATDFALRCCALDRQRHAAEAQVQPERQQEEGQPEGQQQQQQQQRSSDAAAPSPARDGSSSSSSSERGVQGFAIATCCHHRCCWQHYVAQDVFLQLGFTPQEFELISWMTGWALCGHELPAGWGTEGQADSDGEGEAAAAAEQAAGTAAGQAQLPAQRQQAPAKAGLAAEAAAEAGPWRPHYALPRAERIRTGQMCKALVDAGRLHWLRQQGWQGELVQYCPPELSGENRLLLGRW